MFSTLAPATIALECGTHSSWISSALEGWGHRVLVANPRKLKAISDSQTKTDRNDARLLARLALLPELLHPIRHRTAQTQADLALIKGRHGLLKARTNLINTCRGIVKSMGARIPSCSAESFHKHLEEVPVALREALEPLLRTVGELTTRIYQFERKVEELAEKKYPQSAKLGKINGVGTLTALAFMLVVEDPARFAKSRQVGPYLGLTPEKDQSGQSDKQKRISKAGDNYLRMLLVLCAHHILGKKGKDCELRRWGLKLCERGGKAAKKRAVVAVARRLAVQLHAVWVGSEAYDPFFATKKKEPHAGAAVGAADPAGGEQKGMSMKEKKRKVKPAVPDPAGGEQKGLPMKGRNRKVKPAASAAA
jgi:transposase